jgi:hypothetical protein
VRRAGLRYEVGEVDDGLGVLGRAFYGPLGDGDRLVEVL